MKPINLQLRVTAYNKQLKAEEAKIYLKDVTSNPTDPLNYTSKLYERYLQEGTILEKRDGLYWFHRGLGAIKSLNLKALNFLQILVYLAYYETLRVKKIENTHALLLKKREEEEQAITAVQVKEKAAKEKPLEFKERDGVTFLKGTNFVISKIV